MNIAVYSLIGVLVGFAIAFIPYIHLKNKYDKLLNYILAERNPAVYAVNTAHDYKTFPTKTSKEDETQRKIREAYDRVMTSGVADDEDIELIGEKRQ